MTDKLTFCWTEMQTWLNELGTLMERLEAASTFEQRRDLFTQAEHAFNNLELASSAYEGELSRLHDAKAISYEALSDHHAQLQQFHQSLSAILRRIQKAVANADTLPKKNKLSGRHGDS